MAKPIIVAAILFLTAMPVQAEVMLENMTWTELRSAIAGGETTVIVPIGGTEQSGPHIALGKHNARVGVLARLIAEKVGNTLVAPVVAYVPEGNIDPPTAHMRFPGTISLTDATFTQMLEEAGRSLRHAGFTHVVFIGDHGGYQKDLVMAAEALNKEWGKKARAIGLKQYYEITQTSYVSALHDAGFPDSEIGSHAALADTSLELATAPEMVRAGKIGDSASARPENGVYGGSPAHASAALGQKGVDLIVDGTTAAIRKFINGD